MRSTFGGLETGLRALRAQQLALELTGHNIANADTPGYSRQAPRMSASDPYTIPTMNRLDAAGQVGTGVEVYEIIRMRDEFLDRQIQYENSSLGRWEARQSSLEQLEVIFQEPSENGLAAQIDLFWKHLEELATRPDNISVRSTVLENGKNLAVTFNHLHEQLANYQKDLDKQAQILVERINSLSKQIADLNKEIGKIKALGEEPNDLLDKREALLQELSGITNVTVQKDNLSRYTISIEGTILVTGDNSFNLSTATNTEGFSEVVFSANNRPVKISDGRLKGLMEMRDVDIRYYLSAINNFASTMITWFNDVHRAGYGLDDSTGLDFFSGNDASNIGVNINDPERIAASDRFGAPGNGENAVNLANVINKELLMNGGTATLSVYYGSVIAKLGVDAEKADTMAINQDILVKHLHNRQESVAGVSLDEEMANLMKFQNSYNAAARLITTMDEILDRLINGTGVVGR